MVVLSGFGCAGDGSGDFSHSRLDHIKRIHDQNLGYTGHGAGRELVYKGQWLIGRHDGGWRRVSLLL